MSANALDTRFAQLAYGKIVEALNEAHQTLSSGSQVIREDAAATGMNCVRYIGLIEGLETALHLLKRVDAEMAGKKQETESL